MMDWLAALTAIGGSGAIGAVAGHLTARRRARSSETLTVMERDERRIDKLEGRLDRKDVQVEELRTQAAECEMGRSECKRDLARLGVELGRVRADQDVIRHTIRSTPPGAWKADLE